MKINISGRYVGCGKKAENLEGILNNGIVKQDLPKISSLSNLSLSIYLLIHSPVFSTQFLIL